MCEAILLLIGCIELVFMPAFSYQLTKSYCKADEQSINSVNQELNDMATELDIGDRIETTARQQAFISLKDHKENFQHNPKCRLLNPAKNNLGLISKQILDRINSCIRSQTTCNVNQWGNTHSIIDRFSAIKNKSQCTFLSFDIVDFYRTISEALLTLSMDYAKQFVCELVGLYILHKTYDHFS